MGMGTAVDHCCHWHIKFLCDQLRPIIIIMIIMIIFNIIIIIMVIKWGVGTRCVPTPKMAYFSVFKAFLFLKYFKNNLGLIESSFNP